MGMLNCLFCFFSKVRARDILCKEQQAEEEQSEVMSRSVHGQS